MEISREEAEKLIDEYEAYYNRHVKKNHALPFCIWLKYVKHITNFPWKLFKEED